MKNILKDNKSNVTLSLVVTIAVLILAITLLFLNFEAIKDSLKAFGHSFFSLIQKLQVENIEGITFLFLVIGLSAVLFLSFYLVRSSYENLNNEIRWKKVLSTFVYFISNGYIIIIEVLLYGVLFLIGFYYSLNYVEGSLLNLFLTSTLVGIVLVLFVYGLYRLLFNFVFKAWYGLLITLKERKWHRDIIDAIASSLFIVAIVSSIIGLFLGDSDNYEWKQDELEFMFAVSIFSIALYIVKCMKSFAITYYEDR